MVSNASELFPEPLKPVITVNVLRGISTLMFFRLCWRAPCTVIRSSIAGKLLLSNERFEKQAGGVRTAGRDAGNALQSESRGCPYGARQPPRSPCIYSPIAEIGEFEFR